MHAANNFALLFFVLLTSKQWTIVLVATVCEWLLGALWYGVMFKKSWRTLVGYAEGEKQKNAVLGAVASFITCFLLTFVLVHIIGWAGANTFTGGSKLGVICWAGFIAPPFVVQHIYERRRANLFAINGAYWLLVMALGGGLLGAFHS